MTQPTSLPFVSHTPLTPEPGVHRIPPIWPVGSQRQYNSGMTRTIRAATAAVALASVFSIAGCDEDGTYYSSCDEVVEAGKAPLHKGDPGYSRRLDRDGDGVACNQ